MPLDVAIIGYGTAGQAAAVLLSRDGHRMRVFERACAPGPVGAGLLLQPTGLQVLWRMGLLAEALAHGAPVRRLYGETARGRGVMDMRYASVDARLFGLGMQRGALFELLRQAWQAGGELHAGVRIEAVDPDTGRLRDAEGRSHGPFDLVVVADGAASRLRACIDPHGRDRPYPWGALWCLLPAGDWPHGDELRQRYRAARRMVGLLPVGTRPGDATPQLSFFWSLPTDAFADWPRHGLAAWRAEVATLWPDADRLLGDAFDAARLARASYRDGAPRRWHAGRAVLLGDAAHAMSPQLGQGVNMALMDACALRDALRDGGALDAALARYAQVRRRHVRLYQFWSRWLTPVFQSRQDAYARLRDIAFLPLGRMPPARGHMVRVLGGLQHGVFGALALDPAFLAALPAPVPA